jgi:hypothetical protein
VYLGDEEPLTFVLEQTQAILFARDYKMLTGSDVLELGYMMFAMWHAGLGNLDTEHDERVRRVQKLGLQQHFDAFKRKLETEMTRRLNLLTAYRYVKYCFVSIAIYSLMVPADRPISSIRPGVEHTSR